MSGLTRDRIGKLLEAHSNIGNISSLISSGPNKNKTLSPGAQNRQQNITKGITEKGEKQKKNHQIALKEPASNPLIEKPIQKTLVPVSYEVSPEQHIGWTSLVAGKEFDLIMYLIGLCEQECSLRTPPILSKDLTELLSVNANHLRNIIFRLIEKKLIRIVIHKSGRHAIRVFEFEKNAYSSLVMRKHRQKRDNNLGGQAFVEQAPSDLADNEKYSKIDIMPMEPYGFNLSHLIQIYREYKDKPETKLTDEIIQDSINAMAFDLQHNDIRKDFKYPPAVVLTSLLKKGKPYSSKTPEKLVSPQVEAMRKYVEVKSQEWKVKEELHNRSKELAFQEWRSELSEHELMEFCYESDKFKGLKDKTRAVLIKNEALKNAKDYFEAKIWPEKLNEIFNA